MKFWWNGQLTDRHVAVISAFDHGFLYGMGLFETFRTYNGQPWLLEQHATRMQAGCEQLGIRYTPDLIEIKQAIAYLLEANNLSEAYIRWSVSAGEGAIGLPTTDYDQPNVLIHIKELVTDHPDTRQGKTVRKLKLLRSTPETGLRLKSFHYMNNIVAKRELIAAGSAPGTEGLFLHANGHIVEGMVSNIFWISQGTLYTPSVETGLLPGITREAVIALVKANGRSVQEGFFKWEELVQADEVFLTSSIQEIVPVTMLEDEQGRSVSTKLTIGPNTTELMRQYRSQAEGRK
ncbi:MAG: aminodeoxychorismate lyase [Candidatus Cohnella colombiensis]|uniref:Aminodeoxychorismate lyase n=1 Tax=Candidatus Cohnella colombiensis TaxID=3121368 RepID=A0AA95JCV6_9BACL|nr:MAG: aminodeoxychorismate lyase [Cohnella sp.]